MCIHFNTILACDNTDRFAITILHSACIGMLTRDKNWATFAEAMSKNRVSCFFTHGYE